MDSNSLYCLEFFIYVLSLKVFYGSTSSFFVFLLSTVLLSLLIFAAHPTTK